jgi:cyclase
MQKITDNVYVETGFQGSNNTFVVTSEGIVMIDTPQMPADAIKWRDEIAKYGQVRYVINSEPHGDHFTGNYFYEGTVVGHEGTREAILESSVEQLKEMTRRMAPDSLPLLEGFTYRPPTITFSQRLTFYLGKHTFQLINLPGHSPYQVAVYIPEEKVVCTSDNVVYKTQPFLRQALPYDWLDSLKRYQEFDADYLVPGHGEVCDRSYLPEMASLVQAWIDAAKEAIDKGMSLEEAQKDTSLLERHSIKLTRGPMTEMMAGGNLSRLYELLKK